MWPVVLLDDHVKQRCSFVTAHGSDTFCNVHPVDSSSSPARSQSNSQVQLQLFYVSINVLITSINVLAQCIVFVSIRVFTLNVQRFCQKNKSSAVRNLIS